MARAWLNRISATPDGARYATTFVAFIVVGGASQLLGADPPAPFGWAIGAGVAANTFWALAAAVERKRRP